MVMTARTCDGNAHDRFGDDFDLLIDDVHNQLWFVLLSKNLWSEGEVPGSRQHVSTFCITGCGQEVTCNLILHKAVVREILIERLYNPVAVTEGITMGKVLIKAVGISIACDIEPVPSPALTKRRASQERVNHFAEGVG